MRYILIIILNAPFLVSLAQESGFPYAKVSLQDFKIQAPSYDSGAAAIVLNEFGEAYVNDREGNYNLIFEHHYLIKILTLEGLDEANISISLYKQDDFIKERIRSIKASSYNVEGGRIQQVDLDDKNIFSSTSDYMDQTKFAIPNVRVGSIIEVSYQMETPFYGRNFHPWEFQSHLPKVASEYWATIPANYIYHILKKGYLTLSKNESSILKFCFDSGGAKQADCALYKFAMKDIPSFVEEEYMTAKSNFLAAINFELLEVRHVDGRIDKVTNDWTNADQEMKEDQYFGSQLKKGRDIWEKLELTGSTDSLEKATKIYNYIRDWYTWNGVHSKYSRGIKKAFDAKTGSTGDINLSLIAALRASYLDVEPIILSTRENGLVTEFYPALSDFNYVIAKLQIGNKTYLLDATEKHLPLGMLPERCLNGKGRVLPAKNPSYWLELKPSEKYKRLCIVTLTPTSSGTFVGTIQNNYYGYHALAKRKHFHSFSNQEEYVKELNTTLKNITITKYEVTGMDDLKVAVSEKMEVEVEGLMDASGNNFFLNPFLSGKMERNPFRSNERFFPVDFGAPVEHKTILYLTFPSSMELVKAPEAISITLPGAAGKLLFDVTTFGNKLTVNYLLSINKTVFNSTEYHYLRELYSRAIQTHNTDLIFKKK